MFMKRELIKRSPEEKERLMQEIQRLGVVLGCRKHNLAQGQYYRWLNRYNALGLDGLEDRRGKNQDLHVKRLEKENGMLKELLAEKELEMKMKDELLKKKIAQWNKGSKS